MIQRPDHAPEQLLIFATGGTIGMAPSPHGTGLAPDPHFPDALEHFSQQINSSLNISTRINHLSPAIDSANADAETAPRIARALRARVSARPFTGVVVTHGTDTLAFTAARLAFELNNLGVPVVLTGSQLPYGDADTDAIRNLTLALRAAKAAKKTAPVSIAFGGAILPAVRATKSSATAFEAFRAESPLGVSPTGCPLPGSAADPQRAPRAAARIISVKFVPGITATDLRGAVSGSPDGVILECYGSGNGPTARADIREALRDICRMMPVVAISQCAHGGVALSRYATGHDLAAAGVMNGADLTLEAAVAKLGYLIDHGFSHDEIASYMPQNFVGECSGETFRVDSAH